MGTLSSSRPRLRQITPRAPVWRQLCWELTGLIRLPTSRKAFIADADTTVDGFLAHEVSSVVPEAVVGTHNEVDDNGDPVYQGIDQSKLVPLLVATIQELEARIAALESN